MGSCRIDWKHSARKELRSLPRDAIARILTTVDALAADPLPHGVRKLVGVERVYRIRVGDYRVIYGVDPASSSIEIVRVRHRKEAYDR